MSKSIDWSKLIGARVASLQEYAPEPVEETALRLNLPVGQLIKLDANENPYGPTEHTLAALSGWHAYHRYPDPISRRLRQAIGEYVGVNPAQVMVGNGSDELIDLLLRLFRPKPARENDTVSKVVQLIVCPPTFGMYEFYGATNDLDVLSVPRDAAFGVDVARIEALCAEDPHPRIVFLASPNNPDGSMLPDQDLERLLALPLLVVLDEAYIEFAAPSRQVSSASRAHLVAERDNLIVLRTFSKWAGLAGLRVGYGVFPRFPALATLEDLPEAQANVDRIIAERARLLAKLAEIPYLSAYPTQANYVFCRVHGRPMEEVRAAMEAHGILLRYYSGLALGDCVRISVGTPMQDESLLMVLRSLAPSGGAA